MAQLTMILNVHLLQTMKNNNDNKYQNHFLRLLNLTQ